MLERSVFELKDLRKLVDISFAGDFETDIRLSAMHQLLSIVSSDRSLLLTIEHSWSLRVANLVVKMLGSAMPDLLKSTLPTDYTDLVKLSLSLLALIIKHVSAVRDAVIYTGKLLLIHICNFHVLSHLLLIYICKFHWNLHRFLDYGCTRGRALCSNRGVTEYDAIGS